MIYSLIYPLIYSLIFGRFVTFPSLRPLALEFVYGNVVFLASGNNNPSVSKRIVLFTNIYKQTPLIFFY